MILIRKISLHDAYSSIAIDEKKTRGKDRNSQMAFDSHEGSSLRNTLSVTSSLHDFSLVDTIIPIL